MWPKVDEVRTLAAMSNAAVIGVSETWLDEAINDGDVTVPGYSISRNDRNRQGGGVCLFVREDITYNVRADLHSDDLETLWVDLLLPKTRPILVGVCYRPPTQTNFYSALDLCFNQSNELETIILGDFNTNMLGNCNNNLVKSLNEFCSSHSLSQLINSPTRICTTSQSLIDLILVSDSNNVTQSGVLDVGISDHLPTYCTRKTVKAKFNRHNCVKIRSLRNYDESVFVQHLNSCNWESIYNCQCAIDAWGLFRNLFLSVLDKVAPFKQVRMKQNSDPWMSSVILDMIRCRDKHLSKFKKTSNVDE